MNAFPWLRRSLLTALAAWLALASSGCLWTPEFSQLAGDLQQQLPGARFKKVIQLSLGPSALGLTRSLMTLAEDEDAEKARELLKEIRRVRLAVYETRHLESAKNLELPGYIRRLIKKKNWEQVVKVQQDDEYVVIVLERHRDSIRNLFVLVLDEENLVMVQAEGRLDRLFERVMQNHTDLDQMFVTH